jgi:hypothetical protein
VAIAEQEHAPVNLPLQPQAAFVRPKQVLQEAIARTLRLLPNRGAAAVVQAFLRVQAVAVPVHQAVVAEAIHPVAVLVHPAVEVILPALPVEAPVHHPAVVVAAVVPVPVVVVVAEDKS